MAPALAGGQEGLLTPMSDGERSTVTRDAGCRWARELGPTQIALKRLADSISPVTTLLSP